MKIHEGFYELSKEQQEEEAVRMTTKYYELAEAWRRIAIKTRQSKIIKPNVKQE